MAKFLDQTVSQFFVTNNGPPADPDSFGIEIEMEGVPADGLEARVVPSWRAVADGSLRNGIEYVSNGPRPLARIGPDLDELIAEFNRIDFTPVFSYRTSLHVHMNCSDLTWRQMAVLWSVYTILELPLILLGGEERQGNVHCLSAADCQAVVARVRKSFDDTRTGDHYAELLALTNRDRRYAAFNWASLPLFNTVEFRTHRGTMDKATIQQWVQTLLALKTAARTFVTPVDVVQTFSDLGPEGFATEVFGKDHPVVALAKANPDAAWEGVRVAQDLAYSRDNWDKAKAKPRKPRAKTNPFAVEEAEWGVQQAAAARGAAWGAAWEPANVMLAAEAARLQEQAQRLENQADQADAMGEHRLADERRRHARTRRERAQQILQGLE